MKRRVCLVVCLVLLLIFGVIPAGAMAADAIDVVDAADVTETVDMAGIALPVPASITVFDWAGLLAAVNAGESVIELENDITAEGVLTIQNGFDITLTSVGGTWTLYSAPGMRHFNIGAIGPNSGGTLTLLDVVLDGNQNGGGVNLVTVNAANLRRLNVGVGSVIQNCVTAGNGGGVFAQGVGSSVVIDGGIIQNNVAGGNGGGIMATGAGSTIEMNSGTIQGNTANGGDGGGGVNVASGAFTMNGGLIYDNTANNGGGVRIGSARFLMTDGTVQGNTANVGGGVVGIQ